MNDKDKEAARSEAEEVNRLQTENTNLKEQDKIISNEIKTYIEIGRKLQAENKKLREALKLSLKTMLELWEMPDVVHLDDHGDAINIATEVLKEV
jgi:hypothetical protein